MHGRFQNLKGVKNILAARPTIPMNRTMARKAVWKPRRARRTVNQKIPFSTSFTVGQKPRGMIGLMG